MIDNKRLKAIEKIADDLDSDLSSLNRRHAIRGTAKGLKNAVPGFVDFLGMGAGAVAGLGSMLSGDGFSKGYNLTRGKISNTVSDPLRNLAMRAGGNAVKGFIDRGINNVKDRAFRRLAADPNTPAEYWDRYVNGIDKAKAIENGFELGTDFLVTAPLYAHAMPFKAVKTLAGVSKARRAANAAKATTAWGRYGRPAIEASKRLAAPAAFGGIGYYMSRGAYKDDIDSEAAKRLYNMRRNVQTGPQDAMLMRAQEGVQGLIEPGWRRNSYSVYDLRNAPRWSDYAN